MLGSCKWVGAIVLAAIFGGNANADTFRMKSGQVIQGRLVNQNEEPRKAYTVEVSEGIFVQLLPEQVQKHDELRPEHTAYLEIAKKLEDTGDAQWKFYSWCKANSLSANGQGHLQRVIELDPDNATARATLDYVRDGNEWVREEDRNKQRGMIKVGKRWMLPEDAMLQDAQRKAKEAEVQATRELNRWLDDLGRNRNREQTLTMLNNIADVSYVKGISERLKRVTDPSQAADQLYVRKLLVDILMRLNQPSAAAVLVESSLYDPDPSIRDSCRKYVVQFAKPIAFVKYASLLADNNNQILNRAGEALGEIGDQNALLPLINALKTVSVQKQAPAGGGINAGFSQEGGASFGAGSAPTVRTKVNQNAGVLDGLLALEPGVNFQYDQTQWLLWYANSHATTGLDLRRDP